MSRRPAFALAAALGFVTACGRGEAPGGAPSAPPAEPPHPAATAPPAPAPAAAPGPSPAAVSEANQIFETRCVTCHGPRGEGNGPASAGLTPKPRDFTDPAWQTSVTDAHIEQIIQYGGAAVGRSPAMPPNPDLSAKPEVVAALCAHVRELRKP